MKNTLLFFCFLCLTTQLSAQTPSVNKEEEAIKKVCIAESQAYADLDYDAYASYHTQSADEQLVLNNPNGTYSSRVGWDSISTAVKRQIQAGKKENVSKVFGDKFTIVIHGDMAFAAYDGSVQRANGKTLKMRENRTLIFTAGQWKILAVQVFIDYTSVK